MIAMRWEGAGRRPGGEGWIRTNVDGYARP
jgi:hypothetical protein